MPGLLSHRARPLIEIVTGREHGPYDSEADVALCLGDGKIGEDVAAAALHGRVGGFHGFKPHEARDDTRRQSLSRVVCRFPNAQLMRSVRV